jgi:hypothetical protein
VDQGEFTEREISSTCWNGQETSWRKGGDSPRGNPTLIKVENQTLKESNFKLKKNVTA